MKHKMVLLLGIMVLGIGLVGVPAQAATFTVDTLLSGIDSANSGQAYQEAQLELACNCQVSLLTNTDINNSGVQTDDAGSNFIDIAPSTTEYFVLKFGTGNTGNDMFFFQNTVEMDKLVWTDAQLIGEGLPSNHVDSISHYAVTSVPEPASLLLLGAGLAGLGIWRRKANKV